MSNQRKINNLGWTFAILIAVSLIGTWVIRYVTDIGVEIPSMLLIIISELILLIPAIIYAVVNKMDIRRDLGFRKVKLGTIIAIIVMDYM